MPPTSATPLAAALTVDQLLLAFLRHADQHYRSASGAQTDEVREIKRSVLHLHRLYGSTPAATFGPRGLATVRHDMIGAGWCRTLINRRVERIKRAFKWAASQELVPVTVHQALRTLTGLQKGRTEARESEPVKPVDPAHVRAALPFLSTHLRTAVELQLLTGMRPGEACGLTLEQIDRTGETWLYRPDQHKTAYRGQDRLIPIGPKAHALLLAFLTRGPTPPTGFATLEPGDDTARLVLADMYQEAGRDRDAELLRGPKPVVLVNGCVIDPEAPLFSPKVAQAERAERARAARKSKVPPSQLNRRTKKPRRSPGEAYRVDAYGKAIAKACERAGTPAFHPNQLRHTFGSAVRKRYGLEAAQVALGHTRADVTQIYAERNTGLALKVATEMG